jgi:Zn-dependent protease
MGKIALAGPVINFIIGSILIIFAFSLMILNSELVIWGYVILLGAQLNIMLGIFNLIPVMVLDGLKIFRWNKLLYFISIILGISFLFGNLSNLIILKKTIR